MLVSPQRQSKNEGNLMSLFRVMPIAWAAGLVCAVSSLPLWAQSQAAPAAGEPQRITVTGSLIKRLNRETPSPVEVFSRETIRSSGAATVEEFLRTFSVVDAGGSVQDGAASGFIGGLSTLSLRGLGSQSTLVLIDGRRVAPTGAVDINFGRGSLISVNTIPASAIERIEVLKDGASALYGSDAIAGVVNYILRRDYQGADLNVSVGANDRGKGLTHTTGASFGVGNLDSQRFNIFGGLEYSRRDRVTHSDLRDRGNPGAYDRFRNLDNSFSRFTPDSVASGVFNYYEVPSSLAGSVPIADNNNLPVNNNSLFGANYIGTAPGCAPENTVVGGGTEVPGTQWRLIDGPGVSQRPPGLAGAAPNQTRSPSFRPGQCRYNLDAADEAIAEQDRLNASLRGVFQITPSITAFADLQISQTKTTEVGIPRVLTTGLVSSGAPTAATWPKLDGTFLRTNALILPVGHPDNLTNGTANPRPVQLIYRFTDLPQEDISELLSTRFLAGFEGNAFDWDFDTALLHTRQENKRVLTNRLSKSKLEASLANQVYRFNGSNTPEQAKSVARDATNEGESSITSFDLRAGRALFKMPAGDVGVALGVEARREELSSTPDQGYLDGDYIGLVANGTSGKRNVGAAYAELGLPLAKSLETQLAARYERYSDFGNSTTGKLGFKWSPLPDRMALRGTAATGFRAPSISQISNSFLVSFNSFQERRILDPIRCDNTNPANPVSRGNPTNNRDCNVLGRTVNAPNPGALPTVISGNPNIQPEKSRSFTFGLLLQPVEQIDMAFDLFYFHRKQEIRVQRGVDIMDRYIANPNDPATAVPVVRDSNQATWLRDAAGNLIPNSGPILALVRQYGNFEYTKTAGLDYDVNLRAPGTEYGRVSLKIQGTYTKRFDQKVLASSPVERLAGTATADLPKTKASATLRWEILNWNMFSRFNFQDRLVRSITEECLAGTTAANAYRRENNFCYVGQQRTLDFGVAYAGVKDLVLSVNLLNATNNDTRSTDGPSTFTFWDTGTADQLGRRLRLGLQYKFL
jgi:iron complex outermembrane recepter protein